MGRVGGGLVLISLDWTLSKVHKHTLRRAPRLEVDPTEAPLLHREVRGDLHEAGGVTLLLDGRTLVCPPVRSRVVPPPAAGTQTHYSARMVALNDSISHSARD